MLGCLSCPKQACAAQPSHKLASIEGQPVTKSFTIQLKDIVLKFSIGAYKHCRPCNDAHESDAHNQRKGIKGDEVNEDKEEELEDERRSILKRPPSESSSDVISPTYLHKLDESFHSSRYEMLPTHRKRRHHHHHNHQRHLQYGPYLRSHSLGKSASFTSMPLMSSDVNEPKLEHPVYSDRLSCQSEEESRQRLAGGGGLDEWIAQVEPGVMITLVALPDGTNQLKRIRFSQELFTKWQAQSWWAENSDMVHELYSLTRNQVRCESPSSSSCSTPSCNEYALRNTPEMLSRVNSTLNSPCRSSDHHVGLTFPVAGNTNFFNVFLENKNSLSTCMHGNVALKCMDDGDGAEDPQHPCIQLDLLPSAQALLAGCDRVQPQALSIPGYCPDVHYNPTGLLSGLQSDAKHLPGLQSDSAAPIAAANLPNDLSIFNNC